MDCLEGCQVADCDFGGCQTDYGSILTMEGVDIVHSATGDDGELKAEIGEAGVVGAWDLVERVGESRVEGDLQGDALLVMCYVSDAGELWMGEIDARCKEGRGYSPRASHRR